MSNNLPTRTTEILISESDLTDKPKRKKKKYYSLEATQDNLNNNKTNNNNTIIKDINNTDNKISMKSKDKIKNERTKSKKNKREEEKNQNISYISGKDNDKLEQNIAIQSKKKRYI